MSLSASDSHGAQATYDAVDSPQLSLSKPSQEAKEDKSSP